jgi:hypothetical protein
MEYQNLYQDLSKEAKYELTHGLRDQNVCFLGQLNILNSTFNHLNRIIK